MVEIGNLRVRRRDGSIFATTQGQIPEELDCLFLCPFDQETGVNNKLNNGYNFNMYSGRVNTEDEFVGSMLACSTMFIDLSKGWNVSFNYIYTGSEESLSPNWNTMFGFGFGDSALGLSGTNDIRYGLPLYNFNEESLGREVFWCKTTDPQAWHRYVIKHETGTTTVFIDDTPQETRQFSYPSKVRGFYFSCGDHENQLSCKIKNFSLFGTLAE